MARGCHVDGRPLTRRSSNSLAGWLAKLRCPERSQMTCSAGCEPSLARDSMGNLTRPDCLSKRSPASYQDSTVARSTLAVCGCADDGDDSAPRNIPFAPFCTGVGLRRNTPLMRVWMPSGVRRKALLISALALSRFRIRGTPSSRQTASQDVRRATALLSLPLDARRGTVLEIAASKQNMRLRLSARGACEACCLRRSVTPD